MGGHNRRATAHCAVGGGALVFGALVSGICLEWRSGGGRLYDMDLSTKEQASVRHLLSCLASNKAADAASSPKRPMRAQ